MTQGNNNIFIGGSAPHLKTTHNFVYENENNELLSLDYNGGYNLIGYSKEYVEKLQVICLEHKQKKEEYYNILLENGLIEKELTQEEKINLLLEKIEKQDDKIKKLEVLLKDKENGQANLFEGGKDE
jgi:hypothetical protein